MVSKPRSSTRKSSPPIPAQASTRAPQSIPHASPQAIDAFVVTAPGLAPLVAAELMAAGIAPRAVSDAGVTFDATPESLFTVNLWSRMASRVLLRLATFDARDFATLEQMSKRVPWERVLAPGALVRLRVTCRKSRLYHSDAVAERVARGMASVIPGARVDQQAHDDDDSDESSAAQLILVRFEHDQCTISADSSGALLHRRGWRQAIAKAPLRETLAAAMLTACEWTSDAPLVDPFCGSGTLGIEAALRARNIAPGLARSFAMEQWPGHDAARVRQLRADARAVQRPAADVPIVMADRDAGACSAAHANAERAGVLGDIVIAQRPLSETDLAAIGTRGLVLTNPPYGLRVSDGADLRSLYARLGDVLRLGGRGWRLAMLVPDKQLSAQLRIPMETRLRTTNGGIAVTVEMTRAIRDSGPRASSSPPS